MWRPVTGDTVPPVMCDRTCPAGLPRAQRREDFDGVRASTFTRSKAVSSFPHRWPASEYSRLVVSHIIVVEIAARITLRMSRALDTRPSVSYEARHGFPLS
jgi:uroporphyrinogen-III synthase